ncbi:MAG: hypothetical protein ACFFAE_14655 [Candidatus Hodarchaeota archaeon]
MEVVKLAKEGKIALKVTKSFSLDNVNQALDLLRKGEIIGRSIITP